MGKFLYRQANQLVFGLEGQVDGTNLSRTVQPLSYFSVTANSFVQGAILGRIGYAFDRTLIYATGGGVFTSIGNSYSVFGSGFTISSTRSGWTVGGGIEYALDNHWSIRGEYRYSNIKLLYDTPIFYTSLTETHHWTENQVKVGFSYKFGGPAPAPVIAKY